ncbi:glycosyltransferase [Crocinitomix catalasitica]|uniref:glycosyltransferase n=1 Tax=Crocinitomix catalasitica TaxID=184607 RepID=UPI000488A52E|nr:glycosyltransferase [Crocinitomix catalasitica]
MNNLPKHPNEIRNATVLLSALDWGFGHVTRLVSVIKILREQDNHLIFAGNTAQIEFLRKDFPFLETYNLDGYNLDLDSNKSTYWQIIKQSFKFRGAIKMEHQWLEDFIALHPVDYTISDNRYGFYHEDVNSILITHQLNLQLPFFANRVSKSIRNYINKFNVCWIPDTSDRKLSGRLSRGKLNIPMAFIGPLNRFKNLKREKKYDQLIILSGPEPERTNFKNYALQELEKSNKSTCFVGVEVAGYDSVLNPSTSELEELIAASDLVISRAGYTTIMEMEGLQQKAELYPTKGQFEQEYLAKTVVSSVISFEKV